MQYYTGRILMNRDGRILILIDRMTNVIKDLQQTTFCVPLINKYSPMTYSIVNKVHWYRKIAKHAGIKTATMYNAGIESDMMYTINCLYH